MNKLTTSNYYLAYLDILGTRNIVAKDKDDYKLIVTMIIYWWLFRWRNVLLYGRLRHFPQKENEVIEMSRMPGY